MGKTQAASEPAASDRPRRHAHRHSGSANRAHFVRTRPFEFHSVCCSQQRYCYNIVRAIPGLFIIADAHESWITDGSWGLWPFLLLARRATESACGVVNYRTKNRVLPLAAEHLKGVNGLLSPQLVGDCSKTVQFWFYVFFLGILSRSSLESKRYRRYLLGPFGDDQVIGCLPTRPFGYDPMLALRILA